jgi:hypothetical protein
VDERVAQEAADMLEGRPPSFSRVPTRCPTKTYKKHAGSIDLQARALQHK